MLVLTRKRNESVVVGDANRGERLLKVTVLEIRGGKVRLGFEASSDVPIHRGEAKERRPAPVGAASAPPAPGTSG
jgi:carbon storage regulator